VNFETASELVRRIREREVSAREVMEAHLAQIERLNPKVNAIVTLEAERALEGASAADEALARGTEPGLLFGLPIAHKDLVETRGIRTTYGSPILRDFVPDFDALIVERLRRAGAITLGKTNVPEFGAGSQTFNEVFGATRNPYDPERTCGGSSGGAAVALACGMIPIADGSDRRAPCPTPPSCWPRSPGPIRARRSRSRSRATASRGRWSGASRACGSRGAATWAGFPWTPASRP
jgi:amidase